MSPFSWSETAGHGITHCQAVLLPTAPTGSPPSTSTARRSSGPRNDSVLRVDWLDTPCGFHLHGLVGCGHLSHACWFSYLLTVCAYLLLFLTELSPLTGSCGSSPCTLGTLSPAAPSLHVRLPLSERLSMLKSTLSPPPPRARCSCPRKPPNTQSQVTICFPTGALFL